MRTKKLVEELNAKLEKFEILNPKFAENIQKELWEINRKLTRLELSINPHKSLPVDIEDVEDMSGRVVTLHKCSGLVETGATLGEIAEMFSRASEKFGSKCAITSIEKAKPIFPKFVEPNYSACRFIFYSDKELLCKTKK